MPGLQALTTADKRRISCAKPRQLTGSVHVDEALRNIYPNEHRWDYAIGLRLTNERDRVFWVEVHPANSRHVGEVVNKATWLRQWLRNNAPQLNRMTQNHPVLFWVSTGRISLPKGSPQARRLAEVGVAFPKRRLAVRNK